MYVLINKSDYFEKVGVVLKDTTKFKRVYKDPTPSIKKKANSLITTLNSKCDDVKLNVLIGDFTPGYLYGNVKTHKEGYPIRPIISQIGTSVYDLAKRINCIISDYIPNKYVIKSTDDFIDIIKTNKTKGSWAHWMLNRYSLMCRLMIQLRLSVNIVIKI